MERDRWYKDMVFYQIWPRSFCDGNGDGIGDLWGVLGKLDYIKSLGVTGIWFSPLYPSPNADFGYDISNYCDINPEYGTLEVFDEVVTAAHARGLKVVMDLVINHTSSEHPWFKQGREDPLSRYHDYYFWRKGRVGLDGGMNPPNNWDSLFEGEAWEYDEMLEEYYLHVFAKNQPDLDMSNPEVRDEVKKIMRFWLDRGVDGFREDVITFISKADGLPKDRLGMPGARGMRFYSNGPHVQEYLSGFKSEVLDGYDCMTIGEAPMLPPKKALRYIAEGEDQTLDMMFTFDHMQADCLFTEYVPLPFSLRKLKDAFGRWQRTLDGKAWNALYLENHDHPRVISRYGNEAFRVESGKMLAVCYLFQKGTPFVYQGQEIGMVNTHFATIDELPDVSAHNQYRRMREQGKTDDGAMVVINKAARDNARTPMQWNGDTFAGFSTAEPWLPVNPNHVGVNVEAEEADPASVLAFYRRAIELRRKLPVVRDGAYHEYKRMSENLYFYGRESEKSQILVMCSFANHDVPFHVPGGYNLSWGVLALSNYAPESRADDRRDGYMVLRPYETRVYVFGEDADLV